MLANHDLSTWSGKGPAIKINNIGDEGVAVLVASKCREAAKWMGDSVFSLNAFVNALFMY